MKKFEAGPLPEKTGEDLRIMRKNYGLTQRDAAEIFGVALKTIEAWEHGRNPLSGPACRLLEVIDEFGVSGLPFVKNKEVMVRYMAEAAEETRGCAAHWFRYLRKLIGRDGSIRLDREQIKEILRSEELSPFQKVTFRRAMTAGTPTYTYVKTKNNRANTPMLDEIRRRRK